MNILSAIILGIIEGITEFLPVSSTFHMLIAEQFLRIEQSEFVKLFSVFIQSGAILSVFLLYFKDLWQDKSLILKAGISFIPTAIIGLTLYDLIKAVFFEAFLASTIIFIVVGVVFLVIETLIKNGKLALSKDLESVTYKHAIMIGLAQALAVFPGVSRAGAVIVMMLLLRFKRTDAARYSFILSIPTIFAASALDIIEMREVAFASSSNVGLLLIGFVVAFASSFIIVKWFISFLQRHSLEVFGWYRIIAGILLLLLTIQ